MVERPLLIPLGSLLAGLCAAHVLDTLPPAWSLLPLLLTTLAASLVRSRLPFLLSASLFFFVWGGLSLAPFLRGDDQLARHACETPVLVEGVVDEPPEALPSGGGRLCLRVERLYREDGETAVTGRLLVSVEEGRARLYTGDRIIFSAKIRRPRNLGLPGEIDYRRRLAYQRVFATAFVKAADDLVLLRAGEGLRHGLDRLAARLGNFIEMEAPGVEGGVLKALLLGDKGGVPAELNDAYAKSGVNHILSISGFHVGIIFLCVFQLLFLIARRSELLALRLNLRKTLLVAALPVVVFYLFLSGAASATVRSVLMIAAFIAALQLKRESEPINSLMLAACAILFAAPQTLFDLSFQLSFLAIWGLVILAPALFAPFACVGRPAPPASGAVAGAAGGAGVAPRVLRWFLLLLAASAAAILATLVPVAYYFQRVSFIGLLANLAVVPLMGYGAVVAGFASLPLSVPAPFVAGRLIRLAAWLIQVSDRVIVYLARLPVTTCYFPTPFDYLLSCLLLCALTFLRARVAKILAAGLLLAILAVRAIPAEQRGDGMLHLYFLSVGQGDANLVRLPDGKWMLVDGGGREGDSDERIGSRLLPALGRLGVRRIDYLVLSHEHPDHLQGVLYLARSFEVGEFWESGVASTSADYQKLKWLLAARGIPVRVLDAAVSPFAVGGVQVEPLWPIGSEGAQAMSMGKGGEGDANDDSLVFRLRHGKSSVLFTGDLGGRSEQELLARGVPLRASLIKVGHHGSRYASGDPFLSAVSPRVGVISAGYGNPFHLPAPSTLARLQRHGIRVYRTDLDGTVEAVLRPGGELTVSTPWGHFN